MLSDDIIQQKTDCHIAICGNVGQYSSKTQAAKDRTRLDRQGASASAGGGGGREDENLRVSRGRRGTGYLRKRC